MPRVTEEGERDDAVQSSLLLPLVVVRLWLSLRGRTAHDAIGTRVSVKTGWLKIERKEGLGKQVDGQPYSSTSYCVQEEARIACNGKPGVAGRDCATQRQLFKYRRKGVCCEKVCA